MPTLFTKIAQREIPAEFVFEDDEVFAIKDINPVAEHHYLVIPKKEIATANDIEEHDQPLIGKMYWIGTWLAKEAGIDQTGYRLVMNCNKHGGQEVYHIHLHVIGGNQLGSMV